MAANLTDESVWAAGVAARLRLLQVNCADAPPSQRREFLCEAVADALKGVPATSRGNYLDALAERFPAWNTVLLPMAAPPLTVVEPTPEELVKKLVVLAPKLPVETRAALARELVEARLLPAPPVPSDDVAKELQTALGLEQPPRWERIVRLLATFADLLEKLDQVACRTYDNLPARPDFKTVHAGDIREAVKTFLTASGEANLDSLTQSLQKVIEKHRRAMVALMASQVGVKGVPSGGREFACWFLDLFSPQNIEDVVRAEPRSSFPWGSGLEERCWKKYSQRFREDLSTPEHIDKKVKDAVANIAERIFQLRS